MKNKLYILILLLTIAFTSVYSQSADFTTSLTNNEDCGGTIVTFTIDKLSGVTDYKWEFGNGQPDASGTIDINNDGTASTSYIDAGNYTVQLTINGTISTVQQINIYALPQPDFDVINGTEETCINATADVDFEYTGTVPTYGADIITWSWNFGDGTGEHSQTGSGDVTYTYHKFGEYTVLLDVTDQNGCSANTFKPSAVTLHSTPKVNFDINKPANCSMPISVDFIGHSTNEDGTILSYEWTFTEISTGTIIGTSIEQNPTFEFTNNGDYYANLKVNTSGGCVDEMTQTLNFNDNTTLFEPSGVQEICAGNSIGFINTSIDGAGTPTSFYWDFGDGEQSTDENPTHIYSTSVGSPFSVTLQVTFNDGCVGTYTASDLVKVNSLNGLSLTVDKNVSCKNYTVTATGTTGGILYQWDFNYNDTTPSFDYTGMSNITTHTYSEEGIYHIFLRTTNTSGCFAETVYDSINIKYPEAKFDVIAGADGCFSLQADFDADSSINLLPTGENTIVKYEWDFENDGTIDQSGASSTASFVYANEGEFDVKLIITTETGCTDTIIKYEAVERGLPPTADFTVSQTDLCINTPVHFTNHSTSDPLSSAPIDSLVWNFGDGIVMRGNPQEKPGLNYPNHVYIDDTQDNGVPFTARLTVFNKGCASSMHTEQVDIDYPVARFTNAPGSCNGALDVPFTAFDGDNLSEGVDEYRWDFGDGSFFPGPTENDWATGNNPDVLHSFFALGVYDVQLFVKNYNSTCSDNVAHSFTVEAGNTNFKTNDTIVCRNTDEVNFINTSFSTQPTISYTWDFGDGASPATYIGATPPPIIYSTNGLKTITLITDDDINCNRTKIKIDYIDVRGPKADFDWLSQNTDNNVVCIEPNQSIAFTSTTSSNPNSNTNITFEWNFGIDANPQTITRTNENPINVTYSDFGLKSISLKVTDDMSCIDEIQKNNIITVPKLDANLSIDGSIYCTGYDINFTDNSQYLQNYDIVNWQWDFGTDAVPATSTDHNPTNILYTSKGTKTISLTVTNNKGCIDTYVKDFHMYQANASFTNIHDAGCAPADVQFTDNSEDIVSWDWNFGDPLSSSSSVQSPSNIYIYPGKYDVTLITTSIGGCKDTLTKSAGVFVDGSTFDSLTYIIDQACLYSPNNPEVTYTIHGLIDTKYVVFDFGDGSPAYNYTVSDILNPPSTLDIIHTYDHIGTFSPKITLQDDPSNPNACGQFIYTPDIEPIIISEKPNAMFSDNSAMGEACSGSEIQFTDESTNNDPTHLINSWVWNFGDASTSTSSNQNPTFTYSDTDIGTVVVTLTVSNALGCTDNYTKTLTIEPGLDDATTATNDTICTGTTITLDAEIPTGGDGSYVYLWKKSNDGSSWQNADGINNQEDYTPPVITETTVVTMYYKRKVTSATCNLFTPIFTVTTYPTAVGGYITPSSNTACFNNNMNVLNLTGSLSEIVEWQSDTNADFSTYISIANTTTSLWYNNLVDTTYYRALIKSGVCPMVFSDTAVVNVMGKITGNEINPNDTLVCAMESPGTIIPTAPAGGSGNFTYQWKESADSINFADISGETNATYNPSGLTTTRYFLREVTSDGNCKVQSNVFAVYVIPQPDTNLTVTDPFVCAESYSTTPNVEIYVENSEVDVTYQVFLTSDNSPQSAIVTGIGADLAISVVTPITTTEYYILATPTQINGAGNTCPVKLFDHSTITIVSIPDNSLEVSDAIICEGQSASITITASELDVKYYLKLAGVVKAYAMGNGSNITFTVSPGPITTTTYEVWAVSTINNEICEQVQLVDPAVITVLPTPDNSLIVSDPEVCGEDANFTITVENTNVYVDYLLAEQGGVVIQTLTGTGGNLNYTLTTPPTANVYEIWAKAHDLSNFGTCDSILLTDLANVSFAPIPDISLTVVGKKICAGDDAEIIIKASENNVEYTLTPSGYTVIGNGGDVVFPVVSPAATTIYTITAKSMVLTTCNNVTLTNTATIVVIPEPSNLIITYSPNPAEICSGDNFDITIENTENMVQYLLLNDGTLEGSVFGDGSDKTFTNVYPAADAVYTIWAVPMLFDDDENECSYVKIGSDIYVNVDGPITIDIQPINPQVCSGSNATFGVIASNASGDLITYQWQTSTDDVTFVDIVGETSATLTVNSNSPNYYRVIVGSTHCSSIISNSAHIIEGALPISDNLTLTINDQCLGSDIEVVYQSDLATNEYYRIYYNVSGSNTIADTSIVTLLTNGSGVFTITADSFPNKGANALVITEIDYAYGQACSQNGLAILDVFNIEEIPDTSNFELTGNNICLGSDGLINVSSNLENNVYNITYNLSGANTIANTTGNLEIVSHYGQFKIPNLFFSDTGLTTFTITKITNSWGQTCSVDGLNDSTQFVVEALPDATALVVTIPNICSGDDAVVDITGNLIDGNYQILYNLSGANNTSNMTNITISNGDGTGSFIISEIYIQNNGTTDFEITDILFTTGEACETTGLSVQTSFDVEEIPNVSGLAIYASNICEGEDATVYFTSNLSDGDYILHYLITGDVPTYEEDVTLNLTTSNGNSMFTIDAANIPVSGFNTIYLTSIKNAFGNNCQVGLQEYCNLTIEPLPDTTMFAMQIDTVCPSNDARVYITGSMIDGHYLMTYDLSGANTATGIPVYVHFTNNDGTAEFTIPGTELVNNGLTTITLKSANFFTGEQCGINNINIDADIMVEPIPDINNLAISTNNICLGNSAEISVTSTLADGDYIITYNIENANYHTGITDTINIISGNSSFVVNASNLDIEGTTTVVISDIMAKSGQQCEGVIVTAITTSFEVEPLPNIQDANFIALDACQGDDVQIYGTSNLIDGSYIVYYHITGVNVHTNDSVIIDVTTGDGNFTTYIPASYVPNFGASTIWIDGVRFNSGESCYIAGNYQSNFTIAKIPNITNLVAVADSVCLGSFVTVDLNSNLDDGTYIFTMNITGANPNAGLKLTCDILSGVGQLIISADKLLNVGVSTITINQAMNNGGAQCASGVYNTSTDFEIYAIPNIDTLEVDVNNVCLTFDAPVTVFGTLTDSDYTVEYDLIGANTATGEIANITISGGVGTFNIPTALLPNTGSTECIIRNISFTTGLSCDADINISGSFIVIPDPGTVGLNIFADAICLNTDATINFTSQLPQGDYLFTYDLSVINDTLNLSSTGTINNNSGDGFFIVQDTFLTQGGIQTITVTGIDVLGASCSSTGLNITTDFNIEGNIQITKQPIGKDKCEGLAQNYQIIAQNNGAGDIYYQWYSLIDADTIMLNNQGVFDGTLTSSLVISDNTGLENTMYKCAVFTEHCPLVLSDSIMLKILTGSDCGEGLENIPDAISPNGDGVNDTWVIDGIDNYANNNVKIFSRWGNLVFETTSYNNTSNNFDGKGNQGAGAGKDVADGTYFYFIDLGDGQEVIQGYIVVNR